MVCAAGFVFCGVVVWWRCWFRVVMLWFLGFGFRGVGCLVLRFMGCTAWISGFGVVCWRLAYFGLMRCVLGALCWVLMVGNLLISELVIGCCNMASDYQAFGVILGFGASGFWSVVSGWFV